MMSVEPVEYQLSSYFLNLRRIADLIDNNELSDKLKIMEKIPNFIQKQLIYGIFEKGLLKYLNENKTPTLEQLLYNKKLERGRLFTCHRDFYCKGLSGVTNIENVNESSPMAQVYSKLSEFNKTLKVFYRPIHLTSASSWVKLTGHTDLMVIGVVDAINSDEIIAKPLVMADVVYDNWDCVSQSHNLNKGEIHVDSIDSFKLIKDQPQPHKNELNLLKSISETDIKKAFAEIIDEQAVPNDWGGEKSDLFSTHVEFNNERISTAFLFKGPSAFHPMKAKDLGKNGDQIDRLFNEPATLLILQHCHIVTNPIRSQMRAYASQVGNLRLFCIINGYDTLRILRAYSKCGL